MVEGYTDVISMFEAGIENVVASSGTSLTNEQVKILGTQTRNITVLYDGDRAGIKASLRGIDMLLEKNLNVKVCLLPDGEDPDSFAKKHRDSELAEYLETNSTDFLLFKANILSEEAGDDPRKRSEMVKEIVKTIAKVQDRIAQSFYVKKCASLFDLSEKTLGDELRYLTWQDKVKGGSKSSGSEQMPEIAPPAKQDHPEREVNSQDLLYEAEKNIIILLIKYGLFEINVEDPETGETMPVRVDQYVFDELFHDGIRLKDPLLLRIYEHYAEVAEILRDQDDIKRTFLLSEDKEESAFAMQYIASEDPEYSPLWEKRFDMYTNSVMNSRMTLQQEVEKNILTLKLRIAEQAKAFLEKELADHSYTEEEFNGILQRIVDVDRVRKELAKRLNMTISR